MDLDVQVSNDEDEISKPQWHLLRTKAGEERRARDQVSLVSAEVLLPLVRVNVRRWSRMTESVVALFPGYMFAQFDLEQYGRLRYTRGVRQIVRFGEETPIVPQWIIDELKRRCANGPIELPSRRLVAGQRVIVIDGPFRQFEGIFERHLSGPERVAVLLSVMGAGRRAVLPASMVAPLAG
ncbi:MAG TPA: transcription termination/antitermination NusG family protein [Candidatus Binataceae bacterium]|nr:transcription termination/antitermination NusG family protein [Candidatus Binataceae bacterium]